MTEQEYMDITDLARLRTIQRILVECHHSMGSLHNDVYKLVRILEIRTKDCIEEEVI